jgi:hypothetical protein
MIVMAVVMFPPTESPATAILAGSRGWQLGGVEEHRHQRSRLIGTARSELLRGRGMRQYPRCHSRGDML